MTRSRVDLLDLLLFSLLVLLIVPSLAWFAELLVSRRSERRGLVLHAWAIGLLFGLVVWQALDQVGITAVVSVSALAGGAALVAFGYLRTAFMRTMAGLLALATPVVLATLWLSGPGLSVLGGQGSAGTSNGNGTPVVVVVLDEFPLATAESAPGRIDSRFPNFSRLAREGTWYRNALSVADVTTVALPAILAGARGGLDTPPASGEYPENLFSLLGGAGYEVNADEQVSDLCPHDICTDRGSQKSRLSRLLLDGTENGTPLPADLATRIAEPLRKSANRLSPRPGVVSKTFTESLPASGRSLSFVHLMLPHVPWVTLPDGRAYEAPEAPGLDLEGGDKSVPWEVPQPEIDSAFQRQQLQLAYLDSQIGLMIDRMERLGTWRDSLVIVVGDHGASFTRGMMRRHLDEENAGWILPVPLFVKYPGQVSGQVDPRPADLLDVLPTILDVTGVDGPDALEGSSLLAEPVPREDITAESTALGELTLGRAEVERARAEAGRRRQDTFDRGNPWAMAGSAGLIGEPLERLPGLQPADASFESPWPEARVVHGVRTVPAYVTGTAATGPRTGLVIAVNGRIAGTLHRWTDGDSGRFAFTLPPGLLRDGENRVELFEAD
ncbi:MAG: sulfatase-like hydrolase/transferase [Actinomycetota bacterium]|nr:sulfatase-like hydrolase/transferase [Actinomycetota bacterium]